MSFAYHEPTSLSEAVRLGADFGADGRFLAGGTDLMIQMRRGKISPRHIVSLHKVPGLDGIGVNGGDGHDRGPALMTLGALVTHRTLERNPAFQGRLRGLVEGAEVIGGHQVRNVATVGGNIVNASPAADVVPVLLALDATVTCAGLDGERTLPLDTFHVGPGQTTLRPGEVLTTVRFPVLPERSATAFLKAGRRKAMEISVVCVAARLTLDEARERCVDTRIVLGAVAPTTWRARSAEESLSGRALGATNNVASPAADVLRHAGRLAAADCQPISDVRASARYRAHLVEVMVSRALARCLERIRGAA